MAVWKGAITHKGHRKTTSQGRGGRGRSVKVGMSTMNKSKKRSHKKYRGQGRWVNKQNIEEKLTV
jgi:hypothetical protein